jgi:hypothetical protein
VRRLRLLLGDSRELNAEPLNAATPQLAEDIGAPPAPR